MKQKNLFFFLTLTTGCFLILKTGKGFLRKDCSSLYKKYSKKIFKPEFKLSLNQERVLIQNLDSCSIEKELWFLVDLISKKYSKENLILKQKEIEKKSAKLAYYKWKNYEKAIKYYSRLLKRPLDPGELFLFQHQIASSYFKLEKSSQSLIELEKSFFAGMTKQERRKAFFFKLQIFLFQKDFSSSENLIKKLLKEFPKDQDFLRETLAVLYESQNKLSLAIEELKEINKETLFIKSKIKRLEERLENQP